MMSRNENTVKVISKVAVGTIAIAAVAAIAYRKRNRLLQMFKAFESTAEDIIESNDELADVVREVKKSTEKIHKDVRKAKKQVAEVLDDAFLLNSRQEAIYKIIKDQKKVAMPEIEKMIAGVTNRTLRRDANKLEKLGLIERTGKTKDSFYKIRT